MNKSLPTHKDYEQYKAVGGGWYGGTTMVESEDYKQNRRLTSRTNTQRGEIVKELQSSLDRLDRQNRTLRTQMQSSSATEASRKMLAEEVAKNDALTKLRRAQLADTLKPSETPTRAISGKEAQDLDAALLKSINGLRRDFTTLFQRFSAYLTERSSVNAAKAALEAARKRASTVVLGKRRLSSCRHSPSIQSRTRGALSATHSPG